MRLDVALVYRLGVVFTLDDDVGFSKAFFYVAFYVLEVAGKVTGLVGFLSQFICPQTLEKYWSAICHALWGSHNGRKNFVVYLDELQSFLCYVGV